MVESARSVGAKGPGFGQGYLTDCWYVAGMSRDLKPGRMARREILGEPVLLGRTRSGVLLALRDICPHRAAPLSAGAQAQEASGAESVVCPYHGWRFGVDGRCIAVPSLTEDQAFDIGRVRVRRYPAVESQGLVFLWVASDSRFDGEPPEPPPVFPGVVGGAPKLVMRKLFKAHVDHAVVGLMDPAHGPFVHRQWWWRSAASMHAKAKSFEPTTAGFTMTRHPPSRNSRAYRLLGGAPMTEITFRLPGLRWEHVSVGRRQVLSLTSLTPINETSTLITQVLWSDHPVISLLRPLIALGARRFLGQDGYMVDLQNEGLKYAPPLLWIDDADRQAKWYQALKREWAASRREGREFVNPVPSATLKWTS